MMMHVLDRPIWQALDTLHADVAEGGALARRYRTSIGPMAATIDNSPAALAALGALAAPGESLVLLMADPIVPPQDFEIVSAADAVQMLAAQPPRPSPDAEIVPLGRADAEAMLVLAELTKPGPFSLEALALGRFWGVRDKGALIAMAGERMRQPGYTELSGVCTHPDHRGKGLGKRLSLHAMQAIFESGAQPFLHAFASNTPAITLYASIGFTLRRPMNVAFLRRPD